jgi:anti-sigma factor RsiW
MRQDRNNAGEGPSPEEWTAYLDGQLGPDARERCEAWLAAHPEAAAEVEGCRRLARLWESAAPPEPSPTAWAAAWGRVERALPVRAPARAWGAGRPFRAFLGLAAAAAVLGGVLLARPFWPQPGALVGDVGEELNEPLPVATAEEVNIISVRADDADAVVTQPPVFGSFDVASGSDVKLEEAEPYRAGGKAPWLGRGTVPMIVAPAAAATEP